MDRGLEQHPISSFCVSLHLRARSPCQVLVRDHSRVLWVHGLVQALSPPSHHQPHTSHAQLTCSPSSSSWALSASIPWRGGGAGIWEEDRDSWVPEGSGGWKGVGVSQGLDVWVQNRKLSSWSAPHGPRPTLSTSSSSLFPPKQLVGPLWPPWDQSLGKAPSAPAVVGFLMKKD